MKPYMENSVNELKNNFLREYVNMDSTKDTFDICESYRHDNN